MDLIKRVCIFGGTHGNELSGVHLVRKWKNNPDLIKRSSFLTNTLITNPKSVELNRRYVNKDLNRQFSPENLGAKLNDTTPYEIRRVQELKTILSKDGAIGECDMIFDLHNTTANTKVCLIHPGNDAFIMQMIKYIVSNFDSHSCYSLSFGSMISYNSLRASGKFGLGIEVGPQPQGVLRADIFSLQEKAVHFGLDFVEKFNAGHEFPECQFVDYCGETKVPYPRDNSGNITAMIHTKLQDQDWKPLGLKDPVFVTLDHKTLFLKDVIDTSQLELDVIFYPVFVNEAAYYEKEIAFYLTKKCEIQIPKLKL